MHNYEHCKNMNVLIMQIYAYLCKIMSNYVQNMHIYVILCIIMHIYAKLCRRMYNLQLNS